MSDNKDIADIIRKESRYQDDKEMTFRTSVVLRGKENIDRYHRIKSRYKQGVISKILSLALADFEEQELISEGFQESIEEEMEQ